MANSIPEFLGVFCMSMLVVGVVGAFIFFILLVIVDAYVFLRDKL
jgi:hypothetical protein